MITYSVTSADSIGVIESKFISSLKLNSVDSIEWQFFNELLISLPQKLLEDITSLFCEYRDCSNEDLLDDEKLATLLKSVREQISQVENDRVTLLKILLDAIDRHISSTRTRNLSIQGTAATKTKEDTRTPEGTIIKCPEIAKYKYDKIKELIDEMKSDPINLNTRDKAIEYIYIIKQKY